MKEGRVQVCDSGEWHSVCGERWSDKEANVACSTLGYGNESGVCTQLLIHGIMLITFSFSFCHSRFWWRS